MKTRLLTSHPAAGCSSHPASVPAPAALPGTARNPLQPLLLALTVLLLVSAPASAIVYPGNGETGFGGPIGQGSLEFTDNGTNIICTLTKGSADFNDALVLFIDTGMGGFSNTASFADATDPLRQAISGFQFGTTNRSTLTFPPDFRPGYAIAMAPLTYFDGLWQLANGGNNSLNYLGGVNFSPVGTATAASYTFSFNVTTIGLVPNSGAGFKLFGTYVSTTGYRSNEAICGNAGGTQGWNPFIVTNVVQYTTQGPGIAITTNWFDPANSQLTMTWGSTPEAVYSVEYSRDLLLDFAGFEPMASSIASGGSNTTTTLTLPADPAGFVRIVLPNLPQEPAMALIPEGPFTMGDTLDGWSNAIPTIITLSAFYMDINPVTYDHWVAVYGFAAANGYSFDNPGAGKAGNHPVQTVSWYDCVKWCNARSEAEGLTPVYYTDAGFTAVYKTGNVDEVHVNGSADGYRLATEAEWEKAARGGLSRKRFPWGDTISESQANYYGDYNSYDYDLGPDGYNAAYATGELPYTSPVGSFAANGYGLNDMAGNVHEWCGDWYGAPYGQPTTTNPTGAGPGSGKRVVRGGSWYSDASETRCADRSYADPSLALQTVGFRCVRGQ